MLPLHGYRCTSCVSGKHNYKYVAVVVVLVDSWWKMRDWQIQYKTVVVGLPRFVITKSRVSFN